MQSRPFISALCAGLIGLVLSLSAAGCGGSSDKRAPRTANAGTTSPNTTTPAPSTRPKRAVKTIRIIVHEGRPNGGIRRPVLEKGDKVVLVVVSDAGEKVHLHGYNREKAVTAGKPVQLRFTASVAGRFELELHHPDAVLADIEVRP